MGSGKRLPTWLCRPWAPKPVCALVGAACRPLATAHSYTIRLSEGTYDSSQSRPHPRHFPRQRLSVYICVSPCPTPGMPPTWQLGFENLKKGNILDHGGRSKLITSFVTVEGSLGFLVFFFFRFI